MVGRLVLTKSTLSSIPSHVMQYIQLPLKLINPSTKFKETSSKTIMLIKKKIYLLSWDKITITKRMGGLGLQKSELKIKLPMQASLGGYTMTPRTFGPKLSIISIIDNPTKIIEEGFVP